MTRKTCTVRALWDPEAEVWVATSEDVAGLATEAPDLETMEHKLRAIVPELLELNGEAMPSDRRIPLHLVTERHTDLEVVVNG